MNSELFSSWDSKNPPLASMGNYPISATVMLVAVHIISMLVCTLAMALGHASLLNEMTFSSANLFSGHFWGLGLYFLYHNIAREHIWFAVEMLMFFWFGREVEQTLGRKSFLWLYAALVVLPALAVLASSPVVGREFILAGSNTIHFAVFITFVVIRPNTQFFFNLTAKWLGIVFLGIYSLVYLSGRDWMGLIQLWSACATGYVWIKMFGQNPEASFAEMGWWQRKKLEQAEKKMRQRKERLKHAEVEFEQSVDHILEKISQQGIESLTPSERKQLEDARAKLLGKK